MLVIGLIGSKAAGKETVAGYIAKKYTGATHSHSEILDRVLSVLHLPHSRENEIALVALRKQFGENVLINALNKLIAADNAELEAITGIRFANEFENIRKYPNNKIIYIDAPLEHRYEWQNQRAQKTDDNLSFDKFKALETRETEIYIAELGQRADFTILNDADKLALYAKIDDIMKQIIT